MSEVPLYMVAMLGSIRNTRKLRSFAGCVANAFRIKLIWLLDTRTRLPEAAVERIWHIRDSQGQILALAFR